MPPLRVVITGGPGAGKTTLLDALHARGHTTVPESARAVIEGRISAGLSPRPPPLEFAQAVLRQDIRKYGQTAYQRGPVFYDRSAVEALGMLDEAAPFPQAELAERLSACRYHRTVFILPPWQAIYVNDDAREQSFAEAVRVHEAIVRWYRRCLYDLVLVEVPRLMVAERCDHVLRALAATAPPAVQLDAAPTGEQRDETFDEPR
jgi:predicted ATPase